MNKQLSNMPGNGLIVAIDGPSGAGKSTVCRAIAAELGAKYLDTGAMYRVATLHVLRQNIDPRDCEAVAKATEKLPLAINDDPASRSVILDGEDVASGIRGAEVTRNVSEVSANPAVRTNLVALQRRLASAAQRCILDGRDIGTNVLVDAPVKIFLTASPEVRATRRFEQDREAGRTVNYEDVLEDVKKRDHIDSTRAVDPLRPAADAVIVDSSELSLEQVIETIIALIKRSSERNSNE
ncbi:(d)CMP kinase [Corynebacterium pseudotuberculosis]|uniref:Cytidylate kinase n=1 Tax=Corynebacterium pseudotuberculosis (strain C231) TaxID=681645 RepID=D9QA78_CORP2|nr:(d)CMP kinase [Corynebacterium pseudotuberculosis]ADK28775.1 (d)CMP kinase [Corynebacterium pseudotuberculosis FRC41]ADL10454.1 (d)CMP kinase [Corynebacterium pseudotuberculosis C231]ADL20860.1 (d)CMP kinase [Corynebacterium pseudotuberculosis 1002]ADO26249.1 (d)CMP kinase [Corynebacterium pseudotuberculosis I19]AEK92307.1 Cytidylate kinase [Corynebacterium pseudotuberculosis PAT10]